MSNIIPTPVDLIYGAATWTQLPEKAEQYAEEIAILKKYGVKHIDTARIYQEGESENYIGNNPTLLKDFTVTTKAPCYFGGPDGGSKATILRDAKASFESLKTEKVYIFYLHGSPAPIPIEETMSAVQELYEAGKFERFGISNFTPDEVRALDAACTKHNYIKPSVFQLSYSAIARKCEEELVSLLRSLDISIHAYSPMAGGFLAKSPEQFSTPISARWDPNTGLGAVYRYQYERKPQLEFLREWIKLSEETGISKASLAYRWITWHSVLSGEKGDAVLLGASSPLQLEKTLSEIQSPLPEGVAERISKLWEGVRGTSFLDCAEAVKSRASALEAKA